VVAKYDGEIPANVQYQYVDSYDNKNKKINPVEALLNKMVLSNTNCHSSKFQELAGII
jgi:hypothetical protein